MRFLFLFFFLSLFQWLFAQPKQEIRAVWLTTNYGLDWPSPSLLNNTEKQQAELCRILDQLQQAKFNVVFFQARLRGDVFYPSVIEPWSPYILPSRRKSPDYDPLAFAIQACHERGLECHVWFVTYPVGSVKRQRDFRKQAPKNLHAAIKSFQGEWFLDPGDPNTNDYLLSLIKEIVRNYDIDGFHFDYIRYPDKSLRFPDQANYRKYGKGLSLSDWRRDNVNRFVYAAYDMIKELKPWVQVSSSVLGMYKKVPGNTQSHWTAYESVYQDPVDWLKKGKHDFIVPMMYYSDNLFFPFIPGWMEHRNGRLVVPGIGLYQLDESEQNWDSKAITQQVGFSRKSGTDGNAYYRAQFLLDNKKNIMNEISSDFYSFPALLPAFTWLDSIPPVSPPKPEAFGYDQVLTLNWKPVPESSTERIRYNVYRSETQPVDIDNPANLIACRLPDCQFSFSFPLRETGYFYVVTASDRYHNESIASESVYYYHGSLKK